MVVQLVVESEKRQQERLDESQTKLQQTIEDLQKLIGGLSIQQTKVVSQAVTRMD